MTEKLELIFKKERDTKNKIRFAETGETPKVGTIYIPKDVMAQAGLKDKIKITIEPA